MMRRYKGSSFLLPQLSLLVIAFLMLGLSPYTARAAECVTISLVESPAGKQLFKYEDAVLACELQNATLATYTQLQDAYNNQGYESCRHGYVNDTKNSVYMPRQTKNAKCGNDIGLLSYQESNQMFDAYCCFETFSDIFQLLSPNSINPYPFNYYTAEAACRGRGGEIASVSEMEASVKDGFQSCRPGWTVNGQIMGPAKPSPCTNETVLFYYTEDKATNLGVYCYNATGLYFKAERVSNITDALRICRNDNATVASLPQLVAFRNSGRAVCSTGWVVVGQIVLPRNVSSSGCGNNKTGVILRKTIDILTPIKPGDNETIANMSTVFCRKLLPDEPTTITIRNGTQGVIQLPSQSYTLFMAIEACYGSGTTIATASELNWAVQQGFESCSSGWAVDGMVVGPADKNNCSNSTIYDYGKIKKSERYGAYCFNTTGVYFLNGSFNFEDSIIACSNDNGFLSTFSKLTASNTTVCSPGWLQKGSIFLPRNTSNPKCGKNNTGLISRPMLSGDNTNSSVFCVDLNNGIINPVNTNITQNDIFQLLSPNSINPYPFNYYTAEAACRDRGGEIASVSEMEASVKDGFQSCRHGWTVNGQIMAPAAQSPCTNETVLFNQAVNRATNVYCYNATGLYFKPESVSNITDALRICRNDNATVASLPQLVAFRNSGRAVCSTGWVAVGQIVLPRNVSSSGCGSNKIGVIFLKTVDILTPIKPGDNETIANMSTVFCRKLLPDEPTTITIRNGTQGVIQLPSQSYTLFMAIEACYGSGTTIATASELNWAVQQGFESCSPGWAVDGMVVGPADKNNCNNSRIYDYGKIKKSERYGAYCFNTTGVYFLNGSFNFEDSIIACSNDNGFLSTFSKLTASNTTVCSPGWLQKGSIFLPRNTSNSKCGKNNTGLISRPMPFGDNTTSSVFCVDLNNGINETYQENFNLFQITVTYQDRMSFAKSVNACRLAGLDLATVSQANFSYQNGFRSSGWSWVMTLTIYLYGVNCSSVNLNENNTREVLCIRKQEAFPRTIEDVSLLEASRVCEKENATVLIRELLQNNTDMTKVNNCSFYLIATGTLVNLGMKFRRKPPPVNLERANFALCIDPFNISVTTSSAANDVFLAPMKLNFSEAVKYCYFQNTIIATKEQVSEKMSNGFETCSWGWAATGQGVWLTIDSSGKYSNVSLFEDMEEKLLYPLCIQQGILSFTSDNQPQTFINALHQCQVEGLFLSSLEDLKNISTIRNVATTPPMLWVYKAQQVLPRLTPNIGCGQGDTGLLSKDEDPSSLANVYCYRQPETIRTISNVIIALVTCSILIFLILTTTLLLLFYRRY
ncbi:uncharacterized protein LOC115079464 [Rhinatrema bivittatum]|uniref:uncharacterized protein LOC115079464 n=1 Tax=Rhinatrema bivittatum TaxID=194408 RepID=UPI001128361C|nr:uncharacterized protein LOC115079464 [Rhinatrema bivittatum]